MTHAWRKIPKQLEPYKKEIITGLLISLPPLIFVIVAIMNRDFFQIGTYYAVSEYTGIIAYNIVIFVGLVITFSDKTIHFSSVILYYILGLSVLILALFHQGFFGGDITLSVIDGASLLWGGQNPYVVSAVRHAAPNNPGVFRLGTYAYLPVDLIIYTFFLGSFHTISNVLGGGKPPSFLPGFNVLGVVLTNLIFLAITCWILWKTLDCEGKEAILLALVFFIPLIWNNICLTQMLFFGGWYFYQQKRPGLTVFFWTLSMLSKYFTGIFIVALLVEYFRQEKLGQVFKHIGGTGIVTGLAFLLFGPIEVLNSTILFYNSQERTLDGSMGGSLVAEIVILLGLADMVWIFTLIGFFGILIIALRIGDLYKRMIVTSLLALFVISGLAAQFLPMILFVFILSNRLIFFPHQEGDQEDEPRSVPFDVAT